MFLSLFLPSCSYLFYHPDRVEYPLPPSMLSIPSRDFNFSAPDNTALHGRLFLAEKPIKGTVIQFHGNGQNLTSHAQALIWITRHGYNLFVFDYRGYGRSASSPSPKGIRLDGQSALKLAQKIHRQYSPKGKFVVVGQSLGGIVALRAIEDLAEKNFINLIVLDSSFSSYQRIAFRILAQRFITWPFSPLAYLLLSDQTAPNLANIKRPLLVMHSKNDPQVPFECSEYIFKNIASEKKSFWHSEEKGHILGFHTQVRRERFLHFLEAL